MIHLLLAVTMIYLPAPTLTTTPHLFMLPIGERGWWGGVGCGGGGVCVCVWGGWGPLYFLPMLLIDRPSLKPISHNRLRTKVEIYCVIF